MSGCFLAFQTGNGNRIRADVPIDLGKGFFNEVVVDQFLFGNDFFFGRILIEFVIGYPFRSGLDVNAHFSRNGVFDLFFNIFLALQVKANFVHAQVGTGSGTEQ
ncbi:hypothetical protein D3C86_1862670 [compost metagenome]